MPKHLSLETVVEKNKISSTETFVLLAEIDVADDQGVLIETIRLARNNEDVIHDGNAYTATAFTFEIEETANGVPDVSCSFQDPSQAIVAKTEQYHGGVGWKVRFKLVNSGDLDSKAEIEELVYVVGAKASGYSVEFTLGARNPLAQRFPKSLQWRDRCRWKFKGHECRYNGSANTCDYTLQGPNGCSVKGNQERFGAMPGIRPR